MENASARQPGMYTKTMEGAFVCDVPVIHKRTLGNIINTHQPFSYPVSIEPAKSQGRPSKQSKQSEPVKEEYKPLPKALVRDDAQYQTWFEAVNGWAPENCS